MTRPLTVLGASDSSSSARAAVSLAGHLPWLNGARAIGVAAATPSAIGLGLLHRDALVKSYRSEAPRAVPVVKCASHIIRRFVILVFGARSTRGLNRLLLGSVADGLVSRSPVSALVAK